MYVEKTIAYLYIFTNKTLKKIFLVKKAIHQNNNNIDNALWLSWSDSRIHIHLAVRNVNRIKCLLTTLITAYVA